MHFWIHLGKVERGSVQAQGHRLGGYIQGDKAGEVKLRRMWGDSGGFDPEGEHGETSWHKCTAYKEGGNVGGGGEVTYVVSFPWVLKTVRCPVTGCLEVVHSAGQLR